MWTRCHNAANPQVDDTGTTATSSVRRRTTAAWSESTQRHRRRGRPHGHSGGRRVDDGRDEHPSTAVRAGKIFAEVLGGPVAFRRVNDPSTGTVGNGVIIGRYGVMADGSARSLERRSTLGLSRRRVACWRPCLMWH
jgi:hypothetical protein